MKAILDFIIWLLKIIFDIGPTEQPTADAANGGDTDDTVMDNGGNTEDEDAETKPEQKPTDNMEHKNIKILVDNGHGRDTVGKKSPYSLNRVEPSLAFEEWKWNREIAAPIVDKLNELGYDAELIVTESSDISLAERVRRINAICNKLGAGNVLLISVHSNAAGDGSKWMNGRGWSAYTTKGVTKSDKLAECLYDAAESNFEGMKIRVDKSDGDRDWESDFYIIKKAACPAVLTENFFYDNVEDTKYILSEKGREAVISTHVEGIIKYINTLK